MNVKTVNEERVTAVIVDGETAGYTIAVTQQELDCIVAALDNMRGSEFAAALLHELQDYAEY